MGTYGFLSEAFRYPAPGRFESLKADWQSLPDSEAKNASKEFLKQIQPLTIEEWEELYTRTLDLSPATAPYVGYQIWGESYQRGNFLAGMNRALQSEGLDAGGELPDHLVPVLRYLERASPPLPELLENLEPALRRMHGTLRKAEPDNPYLTLLEAVMKAVGTVEAVS